MGHGRNFNLLFAAFFVSSVGDWIFRLAIPIVIYDVTGSPLAMALAYACTFLPVFLIMPIGGVVADHYDRKKLLIIGDLLSALVCVILAIEVHYLSQDNIWIIFPTILALSSVTSVYHPTFQSVVPTLVATEKLPRANSMVFAADNLINILGPLSGGLVVATLGGVGAMVFDSFTYLTSLIILLGITIPSLKRIHEKFSVGLIVHRLQDGFTLAVSNPIIKYGTILFVFANFSTHLVVGNLVYFLANDIGLDAKGIGVTIALTGIGGLLGAIIAPKLILRFPNGVLMLVSIGVGGFVTLMLLFAHDSYSVASIRGTSMALEAVVVITMFTLRQRIVPAGFLGRTVAITRAISFSSIPIASVVGGWLIQYTGGMTMVIVTSGAVLIVTSIWGWFTPFPTAELRYQTG